MNPKIHYRTHKCSPNVSILSQQDPLHVLTAHFVKIQLNIILPSTPVSPKWFLFQMFLHQNPVYTSPLLNPYALHAPPISFFSTLSPEQYLVSGTNH